MSKRYLFNTFFIAIMKLGDLIRKKRIELEYSQRELADLLQIDQMIYSQIENNRCLPCENTLKSISYHLQLNYADLYKIKQNIEFNNCGWELPIGFDL